MKTQNVVIIGAKLKHLRSTKPTVQSTYKNISLTIYNTYITCEHFPGFSKPINL